MYASYLLFFFIIIISSLIKLYLVYLCFLFATVRKLNTSTSILMPCVSYSQEDKHDIFSVTELDVCFTPGFH